MKRGTYIGISLLLVIVFLLLSLFPKPLLSPGIMLPQQVTAGNTFTGYNVNVIIDGKSSASDLFWYGPSPNNLTFEFDASKDIQKIKLIGQKAWYHMPLNYTIQSSSDGNIWNDIVFIKKIGNVLSGTYTTHGATITLIRGGGNNIAPSYDDIAFATPFSAKFVRILTYETAISGNTMFYEVEFTGENSPPPTPPCENEAGCNTIGLTQCSGNSNQTCGNFDADSCLEWSSLTPCEAGEICQAGACVPAPQCDADSDCNDNLACTTDTCNIATGTCNFAVNCPTGQVCSTSGTCVQCTQDSHCNTAAGQVCYNNQCRTPLTCATSSYQCGTGYDDAAGGTFNCPTCQTGYSCQAGLCVSNCVPETCEDLEYECGNVTETCGTELRCGTCSAGKYCSLGECYSNTTVCTQNCSNLNYECGTWTICGTSVNCGTCGSDENCIRGSCECDAQSCSELGKQCGVADDGCGTDIYCGTCQAGYKCQGGQCVRETTLPPSTGTTDTTSTQDEEGTNWFFITLVLVMLIIIIGIIIYFIYKKNKLGKPNQNFRPTPPAFQLPPRMPFR